MSIKWAGRLFAGPFPIKYWEPVKSPVIYCVMMKPNPNSAPTSFRILFFGQTTQVDNSGYFARHRKAKCWTNFAVDFEQLHCGFHSMPGSDLEERERVVEELVRRYKPVCNF